MDDKLDMGLLDKVGNFFTGGVWGGIKDVANVALGFENRQSTWDREDNSMGRKMADLQRSGLNPLLAANGGGSPTSSTAPVQIGNKAEENAALHAGLIQQKASATKTHAEAALIDKQAAGLDLDNALKSSTLQDQIAIKGAEAAFSRDSLETRIQSLKRDLDIKNIDYEFRKSQSSLEALRLVVERFKHYGIQEKYGLSYTELEYLAKKTLNDMNAYNLNFAKQKHTYAAPPTGTLQILDRMLGPFEDALNGINDSRFQGGGGSFRGKGSSRTYPPSNGASGRW